MPAPVSYWEGEKSCKLSGGKKMETILFAAAGYNLAETTRMIEIAKACKDDFHIVFMSYRGKFEGMIEEEGFSIKKMEPRLTDKKLKYLDDKCRGDNPRGDWFTTEELELRVANEIDFYSETKPAALLTGWCLSTIVSTRAANVPFVMVGDSTWIKEFYEEVFSKMLYADSIDMIKKLKSEGCKVYLISASPEIYLTELYNIKEVDMIIGTRLHSSEKVYCRGINGKNCKGEEKVDRLYKYLEENNIEVDFENSYMFSDSLADLPLLELVGNPYLINHKKGYKDMEVLKWK